MSILAGRLAATEGAFFLQESKQAAGRLANKLPPSSSSSSSSKPPVDAEGAADVLPEILRYSIPIRATPVEADASLSTSSKWRSSSSSSYSHGVSQDALNPLRAYVSLPQATFGPRRWQLPNEQPTFSASTANELRPNRYSPIDSEKLKALAMGYSQIGKAFVVATMVVFGGGTAALVYTAHRLQMASTDDIRTKGRELILPGIDIVREKMAPLRTWADNMSTKWHVEGGEGKDKSIIKELSKTLGGRTSN